MSFVSKLILALALGSNSAFAQMAGTIVEEEHPALTVDYCDESGCTSQSKSITVDSNWRWFESEGVNCFTGNTWDNTTCPETEEGSVQCTQTCAVEGATYEKSYGITTQDGSLTLDFVTTTDNLKKLRKGLGTEETLTNVGSRTYLMNTDDKYEMFYLKNREFTFDVDDSGLGCGLNGALYFVEMSEDGGMAQYENNNAGAKFGTGYCDAQCPHDIKFINGEANNIDWVPSDTDPNAGTGHYGTCCTEMDIWEANSISTAYTPHTCSVVGQTRCEGAECGDIDDSNPESRYQGVCDKDGCDLNTYRYGITDFFGPGSGFTLDSTKPMTVVTQFVTTDGTDSGDLSEIKRFYIQDGNKIETPSISLDGKTYDSITDEFCAASRAEFNETHNGFKDNGAMKGMGDALDRGMVLVMSLWDDHYAHMLWLDSNYPTDEDPATHPGVARGTCSTDSGDPTDVEVNVPFSNVTFSNIKIGAIGTTVSV